MSFNYDEYLPLSVKQFIDDKSTTKNSSPLTLDSYKYDLYMFFRFLAIQYYNEKDLKDDNGKDIPIDLNKYFNNSKNLERITLSDITAFLSYCKNDSDHHNNIDARARKACSLRQYFKYICNKQNIISHNPAAQLEVASRKKKLPKYLSLQQCYDLLSAVDGANKERDYCILILFLNCGLRLAELVSLNIRSINYNERKIVITGKGDKERIVYLNDACINAINAYLAVRPHDGIEQKDKDALFISRLNKRMGRQAVQLMVKGYFDKIGLDLTQYSVHKLRHTAATLLYQESGVDVLILKEMLGHENLSTTEIYTHISNDQLKAAMDKNPLNEKS